MVASSEDFWKAKIVAFFHDPPSKPWLVTSGRKHEDRAWDIIENAGIKLKDEKDPLWELAKNADQISAGADRPPLGSQVKQRNVSFKHPVNGKPRSLLQASGSIEKAVDDFLKALSSMNLSFKERYLLIWRFLPEFLGNSMISSYMIPADTRWCDHSLWDHLDAASAIAGALHLGEEEAEKDLALLYVKIPGPQKLISGSKKYKELWGASHMISFVMGKILEIISEEIGPDSVVYPSLRGNPLFDYLFFCKKEERKKNVEEFLNKIGGNFRHWEEFVKSGARHSMLPNKAIIIVNKDKIHELRSKIEKDLRDFFERFWEKIEEKEGKKEEKEVSVIVEDGGDHKGLFVETMMRRLFPRLLWVVPGEMFETREEEIDPSGDLGGLLKLFGINEKLEVTIPGLKLKGFPKPMKVVREAFSGVRSFDDIKKAFDGLLNGEGLSEIERIYRITVLYYFLMSLIGKKTGGVYKPKMLIFYEVYRRILEAGDKRLSRFDLRLPPEYKPKKTGRGITCELCGEAPAAFEYKGIGYERGEGGTLLCPVCLAKILYREAMSDLEDLASYYSSHTDLSVRRYFEKLEEKEGELGDKWKKVEEKVREFIREFFKVMKLDIEKAIEEKKISEIIGNWSRSVGNIPSPEIMVYVLRGDFEGIKEEVGERISEKEEKLRKLCEEIYKGIEKLEKEAKKKGINIPDRSFAEYFSIVKFDGDSVGKLLSRLVSWNEKKNALSYFTKDRYVCLEGTVIDSGSKEELENLLKSIPAIPGPLYHREISTAISYFSLCSLQELEKENCEVLYCGGDDFLVIGDPESWLGILKTLKEKIGKDFDGVRSTISSKGSVRLLGAHLPSWGGSAGVVVSYFKKPLYYVLSLVNEAEESAKKARGEKKRAEAITVLLSSGISEESIICDKLSLEEGMLKVEKIGTERIKELMENISSNWKDASIPRYLHSMLDYLSKVQANSKDIIGTISLREIMRHIAKGEKKRAEGLNKEIMGEIFEDHFSEIKEPLKDKVREEILGMKAIYRILRWGGEMR